MDIVPETCKVILPTAPQRPVTLNNGHVMTSWYDIKTVDRPKNLTLEDNRTNYSQEEILESVQIVTKYIDEEVDKLGGDSAKVFVGGFSQGCAVALATMMHYNKGVLGGCVGLSGMMCADIDMASIDVAQKKTTPVFLYHGKADPMIPCDLAEKTYEQL
mmetsp:Transcript_22617/g.16035  ORF Transcript_22617/g.16035 Transcript_22617/m.16035 type:complete len:159 (+) Transcript_22617:382-858(+)|eukprot:CAMPEP_0116880414 /NCGR_PEP_ID=MMETSP0463-20121206/12341_1 /TAXON_ID=181622 /ORGANISM="Strombidinopsis sp, Strain SopsisLIS2011" /LENGTH=158 /DNA_ID=CAMNT_0004530965 /DNA_START=266 /DNA_END=742 /DNA_ORIENTATION=+